MKIPSHHLIISASSAIMLLLAGLIGFQQAHGQSNARSERFNEQYSEAIKQLHGNVDSGQKKMKRNEVAIPTVVVAPNPALMAEPDPVPQSVDQDRTFILQGISWNERQPLVMIEGKVYKTGDRISGYAIQQIFPQSIILKAADGAPREVTLIREK